MLKIHPAPKRLSARLVTAELREALPRMQRGESVIVPLSRATAYAAAQRLGVLVTIEEKHVAPGCVRVVRA